MRKPEHAPPFDPARLTADAQKMLSILSGCGGATPMGKYVHWDKLKRMPPPEGLTHADWWAGVKFHRLNRTATPLLDESGRSFTFTTPPPIQRLLHEVDQSCGALHLNDQISNPSSRDRYVISSLMEESITSSQLEGASTTRQVAKEMIRTGREPRDDSERMILRNYRAMQSIVAHCSSKLTIEQILDIHTMLEPDARLRTDTDNIRVEDRSTHEVLHVPPAASSIRTSLDTLCEYANAPDKEHLDTFVHPVIKAIVVHFWIGYLHPFTDGNGRTARALFYWCMLNQGYWIAEFLSISRIMKAAPAQYATAYLYTESDDNDLTYFIDYHLRVVMRARHDLEAYLLKKQAEIDYAKSLAQIALTDLNHRQLALLHNAISGKETIYTFRAHMVSHNVVYETARRDIQDLANKGLLVRVPSKKQLAMFRSPRDLMDRIQRLSSPPNA